MSRRPRRQAQASHETGCHGTAARTDRGGALHECRGQAATGHTATRHRCVCVCVCVCVHVLCQNRHTENSGKRLEAMGANPTDRPVHGQSEYPTIGGVKVPQAYFVHWRGDKPVSVPREMSLSGCRGSSEDDPATRHPTAADPPNPSQAAAERNTGISATDQTVKWPGRRPERMAAPRPEPRRVGRPAGRLRRSRCRRR